MIYTIRVCPKCGAHIEWQGNDYGYLCNCQGVGHDELVDAEQNTVKVVDLATAEELARQLRKARSGDWDAAEEDAALAALDEAVQKHERPA